MADNSRRISNTNALNGLWPGLPSPHERAPMEQANPEATSSSTTQPASLFADPTSPSLSLSLSHSHASPLTAASPTRHPSYYTHTYFAPPTADHQATPPEASPTAYHHHAAFSDRQDRQGRDDSLTSPTRLSSTLPRQEDQDDIFADAFEHDIALTMESNSPHDNAGAFQDREGGGSSSSSSGGGGNGNGVDGVYQLPLRHRPLLSSGARRESDQVSAISQYVRDIWHDPSQAQSAVDDTTPQRTSIRNMAGASKRPRQRFENADDKHITHTLHNHGAVAVMAYNSETPDPQANDIWPQCRSTAKLPAKYYLLDPSRQNTSDGKHQPSMNRNNNQEACNQQQEAGHLPAGDPIGRPKWELPVELVELIAEYLNRDDIKALRLVSRELNRNVSQVIFQTVVVPFNTEIYGMLGKDVEPDLKGKKRAKFESLNYSWKNANGDEVYNGHGLDVFRGFGKHIRKYGMSFEVNEDSLAAPPVKLLTENKTSFWGRYDWPFDEYRRFDAVAGLETAADETPRMKTAFSELTKVKELALSVDSGLGWLSGPDKSIRARILRKPSSVFGIAKAIPDRRAQAQQELWRHLQLYHQQAGSDIRHATLYKIDGQRPLSELKEAGMLAGVEPEMPYLDPQLIHEATPHDFVDIAVPASLEDPYVLERFISTPSSLGTGILFTSNNSPPDAGQVVNPIIPANLTKAQQEWLLETEWAQRAFMSSYMLSIIDNPITFQAVHSLNISGLSDRYLPMLNRSDFWDALPSLCDVTLMVIPGWRTVHKDEAGFVATPPVDPAESTNVLYVLLLDQIARRPNIRRLTVGWTTGGEHAEGLYARNKLLCPAPILDLRELMDRRFSLTPAALFVADPLRMGLWLLPLRHVEKLTLKNCWISPQAFLQFSKMHDKTRLKELVLDSVSLMVIPHPNAPNIPLHFGNPQVPPPQHAPAQMGMNAVGGFVGAPVGQFTPHQQQQIVQVYINALQLQLQQLQTNAGGLQHNHVATLQFALQQQLQQVQQMQNANGQNVPLQAQAHGQGQNQVPVPVPLHMPVPPLQHQPAHTHANFTLVTHIAAQVNQMQNQLAAGQHVAAGQQPLNHGPAHNPATPNAQSTLRAKPRPWSWMDIIDQISPGTNLSDFGSTHSRADSQRTTSLRQIEFISCGYAKFTHAPSEQNAVDHGVSATLRHPWFARRMVALSPAMMSTKWPYLADIIQEVDPLELAALDAGWNLRTGWEDSEAAQAVEFDGLLPGGTGRFTGIIRQSDKMVDEASTNLSNLAL